MSWIVAILVGRGLSEGVARIVVYAALVLIVVAVLLGIRQHYVNEGWRSHAAAVAKKDASAVAANKQVEAAAQKCTDQNGFWDVITQDCKLQQQEEESK